MKRDDIKTVIIGIFVLFGLIILIQAYFQEKELKYKYLLDKEVIENQIELNNAIEDINKQEVLIDSIKLNVDEKIKEVVNADGTTTVSIFKELVAGD